MKQQNTDIALCDYLEHYCKGKINAVSSKTLEAVFNLKGSEVRHIINVLRTKGEMICSGRNGYYYAETENEIKFTISQLGSRIAKMTNAKNGLLNGLKNQISTD